LLVFSLFIYHKALECGFVRECAMAVTLHWRIICFTIINVMHHCSLLFPQYNNVLFKCLKILKFPDFSVTIMWQQCT
jgi:hypothetical protein